MLFLLKCVSMLHCHFRPGWLYCLLVSEDNRYCCVLLINFCVRAQTWSTYLPSCLPTKAWARKWSYSLALCAAKPHLAVKARGRAGNRTYAATVAKCASIRASWKKSYVATQKECCASCTNTHKWEGTLLLFLPGDIYHQLAEEETRGRGTMAATWDPGVLFISRHLILLGLI